MSNVAHEKGTDDLSIQVAQFNNVYNEYANIHNVARLYQIEVNDLLKRGMDVDPDELLRARNLTAFTWGRAKGLKEEVRLEFQELRRVYRIFNQRGSL